MKKTIKDRLEDSMEVLANELSNDLGGMSQEERIQKLKEIKLTNEILNEDIKARQEIANAEHKNKIEKEQLDHKNKIEISKLENEKEERNQELEEKKIKKIEDDKIAKKNKINNALKTIGKGAVSVVKGVGKAAITLIPVGLYVYCYANDTYYERYENGISIHPAKDVLKEVLKPAPKIGKN